MKHPLHSVLSPLNLGALALCAGTALCLPAPSAPLFHFSAPPTEEEIARIRVFDEPLVAVGGTPGAAENQALAEAVSAYAARTSFDDLGTFREFLEEFPGSAWAASLLLHLGSEYYNYGYYSKALESWEEAWGRLKDIEDPKGKAQADRSLGELARMYSKLGRLAQLSELLASVTNRPLTGPATQLIHAARQAVWLMESRPGICFRCGPLALDLILSDKDPAKAGNPLILQSESTTNGFSLSQVAALSGRLGLNYQMALRSPGAPWVVPAVIHWKIGHYAALLRQDGNRFLVRDRTFQSGLWMSASALEQEASGFFLVPPGPVPGGWKTVSEAESQGVWGRGQVSGQNQNQTGNGPTTVQCGGSPQGGGTPPGDPGSITGSPSPGDPPPPSDPGGCGSSGMTTYTIDTMLASLTLNDTPVGYHPPVGPWVAFTVTYNQYEANQPATFSYVSLGPKWTCNWIAYITDNPASPGVNVSCYQPGGGTLEFTGFNPANGTFAPEAMTQGLLTQTSFASYQLQFRSGASWVFAQPSGSAGSSRQVFLTQIIDPAGNSVALNYDSSLRLANITDAIGQTTTLMYTNANYPYAITSVQDPFGRTASFQYNQSGLLAQITDVLGLVSQYAYSTNDFISALTTPYGTTTFSSALAGGSPWLQATDPLGRTELAVAFLGTSVFGGSDPAATVPTNLLVAPFNAELNERVTCFWSKEAYAAGAWDPSVSVMYHFLKDVTPGLEGGVLESVKRPLENRVWYQYPGDASSSQLSPLAISRPAAVGRVLDNGVSQTRYYQYNSLGHATNSTDPLGRSFTYVYSTNAVDLFQVIMTSNGKSEVQSAMTYNSEHRVLTVTDTAGQTTTNTYNARGQILSTADPLGELTTYAYDANGYLLSVTGPLQSSNDVVRFTYDTYGRLQTLTDTEGYTLTYAYDALDRLTNITYPDGTTDQFMLSRLDLVALADRLGRWTTNTYNADRQLISTTDPLGRTALYQYCECGALEALFDPMGNQTSWDHDIQSRVTAKHYADGSTVSYTYETTTSRLASRLDERGQQTLYQYYDDDNLQSVTYPNASVPTPSVFFDYDTNYNRVVSMQDGIGLTTYTYNSITPIPMVGAGRLAVVSGPLPNSQIRYQYDRLGRSASRAVNGVAETTAYDTLGRVIGQTNVLGTFTFAYAGATPRLILEVYPNGETNLYSYYPPSQDERLQEITNLQTNGAVLSQFSYAYNAVGQITNWTYSLVDPFNAFNNSTRTTLNLSYDACDEITGGVGYTGPGSLALPLSYMYAYDAAGNRVRENILDANPVTVQFTYNALNQLTFSSVTLSNTSYEWDAANRLSTIISGANRTEFRYDGLGRRVEMRELADNVVVTNNCLLWSGNKPCELRDATGANVLRRLFARGEALVGLNGGGHFYTTDHLGSIRETLDSTGLLESRYDYDPYGRPTVIQETFQPTVSYEGLFLHRPSGLLLTLFRPLSTFTGRWLSRDPAREQHGANMYAFVGNNPVRYTDPFGLEGCSPNIYIDPNLGNSAPPINNPLGPGSVTFGQTSSQMANVTLSVGPMNVLNIDYNPADPSRPKVNPPSITVQTFNPANPAGPLVPVNVPLNQLNPFSQWETSSPTPTVPSPSPTPGLQTTGTPLL